MSKLEELIRVMAQLRDPQRGCPWDLKQDFRSLMPYTLEEAYELIDAIEQGDIREICAELGDLLFQIVFYARLAEEAEEFDFEDVAAVIVDKLVRRHPHVFGNDDIADAKAQSVAWEALKADERHRQDVGTGALGGVAMALPALTRAAKLQQRAARVGFDWKDIIPVFDKVLEELEEVRQEVDLQAPQDRVEDEIGDLLFACTNLARHAGIDPESALRRANIKFQRRFEFMEDQMRSQRQLPTELSAEAWEIYWQSSKTNNNQN